MCHILLQNYKEGYQLGKNIIDCLRETKMHNKYLINPSLLQHYKEQLGKYGICYLREMNVHTNVFNMTHFATTQKEEL